MRGRHAIWQVAGGCGGATRRGRKQPHLGVVAHGAAQALERVLLLHAVVQQPQRGAPGGQEVLQVGRHLQGGGLKIQGSGLMFMSVPAAGEPAAERSVLLGAHGHCVDAP